MIWKVSLSKGADKDFSKLPKNIKQLVVKYLEEKVSRSPREYGKSLVQVSEVKLWRYRVENYRLICQIQDKEITVLVVRIVKRDSVYKNL